MSRTLPDPRWLDAPDACISCGYALSGLAVPGVCPECGTSFDHGNVELFGVPGSNRGASVVRRLAWVGVTIMGVLVFQFALLLVSYSWILAVACFAAVLGGVVGLLATGPRERRGTERFVFSSGGYASLPRTAAAGTTSDIAFVPWTGREAIELKRVSAFWRKLRIGRRYHPRGALIEVGFDAGVRCPDALARKLKETIEGQIARHARPGAPPSTSPPGSPPTAPPTSPGS